VQPVAFFEISRQVRRRVDLANDLPTEHPGILDDVAALLAELPDPEHLCAEQRAGSMTAAMALRNQVDAYLTSLVDSADRHADSSVLHAGTTGTLVAVATGQNPQSGSALVNRAHALRDLPEVAQSFREGRITAAHVAAITADAHRIDDFSTIESGVVAVAEITEPAELRRILKILVEQCRPDGLDDDHKDQHDRRGISVSQTPNGMFHLEGYLDGVSGQQLRDTLTTFMDRADRADSRTPRQRRADALADLVAAAAANTNPLGVSGLSVLVDVDQLLEGRGARFEDGTPLGTGLFDLLTCSSALSVIFGHRRQTSFVPLALARTKRRATAGQWKALVARDRGCVRCGRAPRFCEAHHILHWKAGGSTDLPNLVLMCSRCHHDLHFGRYEVTLREGIPHITPTTPRGPPVRSG
jgi:hypothetical protein